MPAVHVGYFMSYDARQLFFFIHRLYQTGVHKYVTGRCGKCIVNAFIDNMEMILERLLR